MQGGSLTLSSTQCIITLQGATTKQGIVLCVLVVLLYGSRVIYNLIAVTVPHDLSSFGYGWINVSDEVSRHQV